LAGLGEKLCKNPEEFKAWSQNMGHDGVLTTFTSYGEVPRERQARIIRSLTSSEEDGDARAVQRVLEAALAATRHSNAKASAMIKLLENF
jgi:integrase/recombinase XerD